MPKTVVKEQPVAASFSVSKAASVVEKKEDEIPVAQILKQARSEAIDNSKPVGGSSAAINSGASSAMTAEPVG